MRIKRKIVQEQEVTQIKICDMCGKRNERTDQGWFPFAPYIHHFETQAGFGSRRDNQIIQFDLCDDCLENLISNFIQTPFSLKEEN